MASTSGEAMGIPPSNQDISVRGMELWRVADGKVVEHWGVVDISDVLEKAGLIPPLVAVRRVRGASCSIA